jgi:hypothetical protein
VPSGCGRRSAPDRWRWHGPPPRLQVLVGRGFAFCDEGEREEPQFPAEEGVCAGLEPLLLASVEASSTDNPQQAVGAPQRGGGPGRAWMQALRVCARGWACV